MESHIDYETYGGPTIFFSVPGDVDIENIRTVLRLLKKQKKFERAKITELEDSYKVEFFGASYHVPKDKRGNRIGESDCEVVTRYMELIGGVKLKNVLAATRKEQEDWWEPNVPLDENKTRKYKKHMKKIKINESDINLMVTEAVRRLLREFDPHETSWANLPTGWEESAENPEPEGYEAYFKITSVPEAIQLFAQKGNRQSLMGDFDALINKLREIGLLTNDGSIEGHMYYDVSGDKYDHEISNIEIEYYSKNKNWYNELQQCNEIGDDTFFSFDEFDDELRDLIEQDFMECGDDKNYTVDARDLIEYAD